MPTIDRLSNLDLTFSHYVFSLEVFDLFDFFLTSQISSIFYHQSKLYLQVIQASCARPTRDITKDLVKPSKVATTDKLTKPYNQAILPEKLNKPTKRATFDKPSKPATLDKPSKPATLSKLTKPMQIVTPLQSQNEDIREQVKFIYMNYQYFIFLCCLE